MRPGIPPPTRAGRGPARCGSAGRVIAFASDPFPRDLMLLLNPSPAGRRAPPARRSRLRAGSGALALVSWRVLRQLCTATAAAMLALVVLPAIAAPGIDWTRVLPTVVRSDSTAPVTITAGVSNGIPTAVQFVFPDNSVLPMRDDGTGGDRIAGDGIYTVQISAAAAAGGLQAADVLRKFVGFVDIYQGATRLSRVFVQAQVWTPEVGSVSVATPAAGIQYSNFVMNIVDSATFGTGVAPNADFRPLVHRFYQNMPDSFDFIDIVFDAQYTANRYHFAVRNDVSGIGMTMLNDGGSYGSAGTLKGLTIFPINSYFDPAEEAHSHEIGHQWINFLSQPSLAPGVPHWPLSTLAGGIMGYSIPGEGAGGTYGCVLTPGPNAMTLSAHAGPRVFTDLDLYLMGLRPASQVGDHYVWNDQAAALNHACSGSVPLGQFTKVGIAGVTAAAGPRVPAYPNTQRDFRVGVIVVSDTKLSPEAMAYYDYFARRADSRTSLPIHQGFAYGSGNPFFVATGGAGTLTSRLRDGAGAGTYVTVFEFYAPTLNHYFRTAVADEANALKANPALGWQATGKDFKAYARNDHPGSTQPVCRFYGSVTPGPNSHFYTADPAECAALQALQAQTPGSVPRWNYEETAFAIDVPVGGNCPAAAPVPVYRAYNNRAAQNDSNHRYTTDPGVYGQMMAQGWRGEGVVMCAPS